jgi:phage/plasmid-like protein (TIGR03299 family)
MARKNTQATSSETQAIDEQAEVMARLEAIARGDVVDSDLPPVPEDEGNTFVPATDGQDVPSTDDDEGDDGDDGLSASAAIATAEKLVIARSLPWAGTSGFKTAQLSNPNAPTGVVLRDVLPAAGLNWTVEVQKIQTVDGVEIPKMFATVRQDTKTVLGIVGSWYKPVQNAEAAKFVGDVLDSSDAIVETAGFLHGGKRIWFLVRLPQEVQIGGTDPIVPYLLLANSHDRSMSMRVCMTPIRVVCQNTLNAALKGAKDMWSIWHTQSIQGRINDVRDTLKLSFAYYDTFAEEMNRLSETPFSDDQFEALTLKLIPAKARRGKTEVSERQELTAEVKRRALGRIWLESDTVDHGTAYGAYNAITEWTDHVVTNTEKRNRDRRAEQLLWGRMHDYKSNALDLVLQVANS